MTLAQDFRGLYEQGHLDLPLPGGGQTGRRHARLAEIARRDVSLSRLAEAHCDAVAILAEAGKQARVGALYGVWASEGGDRPLKIERGMVTGTKMFCSGGSMVDRALVTAEDSLLDIDMRQAEASITIDSSSWKCNAFHETQTATVQFAATPAELIGSRCWYLERPGFWHGACGPASCWAGGAMGLIDYARRQTRDECHALAHLGALEAEAWALEAYLEAAGRQIDADPHNAVGARVRALKFRHLIEQSCQDVLTRFARMFGPRPLAFDPEMSRRYDEVLLFARQCHGERDLESLARGSR